MAGLSLYPDSTPPGSAAAAGPLSAPQPPSPAPAPPPTTAAGPLSTSLSTANLEPLLRSLFDQATAAYSGGGSGGGAMSGGLGIKLVPGPSPTLISVEFSDVLSSWIRDLSGSAQAEVEGLVCRLLNERVAKARAAGGGAIPEMLAWVRAVAVAPGDPAAAGLQARWKWADQVMRARQAMFMPPEQMVVAEGHEEVPYGGKAPGGAGAAGGGTRKKHRNGVDASFEGSEKLGKRHCPESPMNYPSNTAGCLNQPKRRSGRFLGMLKLGDNYLPRKRIPVGPFFQADVPEWTGPPEKGLVVSDSAKYADDSKWLGTPLWPLQDCEKESLPGTEDGVAFSVKDMLGGADLRTCSKPKSTECNRHHIRMRRFWLRSELGPAFFSMGFDSMGEDVSNSWSREEQSGFDTLVRLNPVSEGATFWYDALNNFPKKNWRDIASYYFNVYVLRRMSIQTRSACKATDSDDDEWNLQPYGSSKR